MKPELQEPPVALTPMIDGREVVEDYRSHGLTLRAHPVSFLRRDLRAMGYAPCAALKDLGDGSKVEVAGLVLVRQRPGSAKGVMFITLEDESDIANLVIWPSLFERQRRIILSASMIGCRGKVQRAGEVIHVVADNLTDLSGELGRVGKLNEPFPLPSGRGDEAKHGGADARDEAGLGRKGARDIYIPDLHIDTIPVRTRDFR